jgi:hypothetical protein
MKTTAVLLFAIASLLSGCVVYDTPHRDGGGYRGDGGYHGGPPPPRADHDRDGVPDNQDRRPNDPNRY